MVCSAALGAALSVIGQRSPREEGGEHDRSVVVGRMEAIWALICVTIVPVVSITPTLVAPPGLCSVNQRFPSGPDVIPKGMLPAVVMGNSLMVPAGVILPILPPGTFSVNHRLLSDPSVIAHGRTPGVGTG